MSSDRRADDHLIVILDAPELGPPTPVGVLTRWAGPVLAIGFQYVGSWLRDGRGFSIDPRLPLIEGIQPVSGRRLPGIFSDTAPDAWGTALLERREGRGLDAWELMVGVSDESRMGALRLQRSREGPFIADREPAVPPLARLRSLQEAARRFEQDPDALEHDPLIGQLVAPGSSLGGARPKANFVAPDGSLWIAKFPAATDRRDAAAWEHLYAQLARRAGVAVADTDLLTVAGPARTFATRRFDRGPEGRRLYASALTLTGRDDTAGADYLDIAMAIRRYAPPELVADDLAQLFRRMAFNVLVGNRDDHLRNHGFIRTRDGWQLAPAFDMNPAREMREHATAVGGRTIAPTASEVLAARTTFGLTLEEARTIIREVADAIAGWNGLAAASGIGVGERRIVGAAFSALATVTDL